MNLRAARRADLVGALICALGASSLLGCGRLVGAAPRGADWTVSAENGAAILRYKDVEVGGLSYVFWGPAWSWVDVQVKTPPATGGKPSASGDRVRVEVPALGLTLDAVVRPGAGQLDFDYTVTATKAIPGAVGGGLELNLKLDSPILSSVDHDVALIPDNRGASWDVGGGQKVEVAFDQPIAGVNFEQGQHSKTRLYLLKGDIHPGTFKRTLTVRLPAGGAVKASLASRYRLAVGPDWAPNALPWDAWPIDVSFLAEGDRPAGRHGRVRAEGDRLVFADGTPARFWGTNVTAYALFASDHAAVAHAAKRLAALGYNLVRIHHHDSDWVTPNVIAPGPTTQVLSPPQLDAIDWWVKCLRDEGIYVWLDLKVGRTFRAGDAVPGFDELTRNEPIGRGFDYVDPRLQELEHQFAAKYLGRVNPYTKLSYLQDPAVIAALVSNEDDLTTHFGNMMLPNQHNPIHAAMLKPLVENAAERLHLSTGQALRYWEPGDAKVALADVEAGFFTRAFADLRKLGFGGLLTGTSYWGSEALYSLGSLQAGDLIDVHAYGDPEALSVNPRAQANFIAWIGAGQVAGKPLSVSEWNVPYPARDRFTAPLYVASIAALQGWDAPMLFAYTQDSISPPDKADEWSTFADPALTALMPAAAVLFRQQHVRPARTTYRFTPGRDAFYGRQIDPDHSATLRTLVEQSRLVIVPPDLPEATWDDRRDAPAPSDVTITDPDHDFIPPGQDRVRSDTGELTRDWAAGDQTIDTPRTQAASGWIGGRSIALKDAELRIETPKATVALTSLDDQPLASSKRILLTVVAQVATGPGNKLPFLSQPVTGTVSLRARPDLVMTPLVPGAPSGGAAGGFRSIAPARTGDRLVFKLPAAPVTHWFLLAPRGTSPSP